MRTDRNDVWSVRTPADLGRAIAGARHARGLTQQELADRTAVDRTYLARLESGASSPLVLERALRALRDLGAEVTVTLPRHDA